VRCHVAFTPAEAASAPLGVVVDVMRATSIIVQALASGYGRVLCCAEIEHALALKEAKRIDGFDAGASPREFLKPRAETLILSTTNGTRSIVAAVSSCDEVVIGALLNLDAVASHAREKDTIILCAAHEGVFAIDDAYCAGRIVRLLDTERTDAAVASAVLAERFPEAIDGINARTYGPPGLEEDIAWCAQVSLHDVVPRFSRMVGPAAEVVL
jgi:2-phosphosulfolactate phosphatase